MRKILSGCYQLKDNGKSLEFKRPESDGQGQVAFLSDTCNKNKNQIETLQLSFNYEGYFCFNK